MPFKNLLQKLGFTAKDNASGIYYKKYASCDSYCIEVDFEKERFNYGDLILSDSKTTLNFLQKENWVVMECVNRLLEKGYQPKNIILEKTWPSGHNTSGRLDVCVTRDDGSEYLLIECKTYGKEFDKALAKLNKDGGQLFTYFKFSNKADLVMLYASEFRGDNIVYKGEIVKIEDEYRTGDVKDFYEKWNKLTKDNGVFDSWVTPYHFISRALTPKMLEPIKQEDSSFIFIRFLEILRHNVVSDKPNAFNKIFTLFLCKIYDEKVNEDTDNELGFQWKEGIDDDISFQLRLTDLYKNGMFEFLEKRVTDFSETEFENKFKNLDDSTKTALLNEFKKIRLEKNNEFAIKEVYDHKSFKENAKVVKEVVELLQGYKIRYTKKQQYLSDFFEMLLTTGLKQESGQFFTPVPVAQFIIKSLPIDAIVEEKLQKGENNNLLPFVMDYAAGSGHFLTETMHEMQRLIDSKDDKKYIPSTAKKIRNWKDDHFEWALDYVYGIEKDYRLVKVGKVGCYLHGDGLANVIHSDGLATFGHVDYKGKLLSHDNDFPKENKQFDIIVSNPPYSVSSFKNASGDYYKEKDFELHARLTDNSSEIECLFIERTQQLLRDGGLAGIILPSSILSNAGIYTRAREIILQYFDIIGITELGSNTFMATGTNTVTLFLRRRNNYHSINLKTSVDKFFNNLQDVTLNGIEKPAAKYVNHVWENISFEDYFTLLQKSPNEIITKHEIYLEYKKKIKSKNDKEFWDTVLAKENEKLYYFILAYPQKVVLIKSGEKDAEKRFLGYEFSNRRGSEGIHPMQRGKSIEECTKLFDANIFDNPEKASTYIYKAFNGDHDIAIDESLKNNISRHNLVDMLTFDRTDFEKNISLAVKKKVAIESSYNQVKLEDISIFLKRGKSAKYGDSQIQIIKSGQARGYKKFDFSEKYYVDEKFVLDERKLEKGDILINSSGVGTAGRVTLFDLDGSFVVDSHITIVRIDREVALPEFILQSLAAIGFKNIEAMALGQSGQIELTLTTIGNIKIPLPPKDIQEKIVIEIDNLDILKENILENIRTFSEEIQNLLYKHPTDSISTICEVSDKKENPLESPYKEYTYLGLEHIESNSGVIIKNKEMGKNILSTKNVFQSGDVLYGKLRPYLNKVALPNFDGVCSTDILVLKTNIPKILKYALLSNDLVKQTSDLMRGVSLPRIGVKDFLNQQIPIPPIHKQQKIVSEIEEIEERINALEKELAAIPHQKEAVLKKYL